MNSTNDLLKQNPLQQLAQKKNVSRSYRTKKKRFSIKNTMSKNKTIEIRVQLSSKELKKLLKNSN